MLYLVDGTSHDFFFRTDAEYESQFRNSFCYRLATELGQGSARYFQGPKVLGLETSALASRVADEIRRLPLTEKVFLCGYSRGGAAVIAAAKLVSRPVEAMFLFDAVDRTIDLSTAVIPKNVGSAYNAIRDPKFAEKFQKEVDEKASALTREVTSFVVAKDFRTFKAAANYVSTKVKDMDFKYNKHRYTAFDNTGLKADPPCRLSIKSFPGTHGAMGGLPWPEVETDRDVANQVGAWMSSNMRLHGYNNFLKA